MNIREVLREMRLYAEDDHYGPDVGRWLITLEAAMREKETWLSPECYEELMRERQETLHEMSRLRNEYLDEIERLKDELMLAKAAIPPNSPYWTIAALAKKEDV